MALLYVPPTRADRLANVDYAMTLEEIGNVLGVTRERVRQIEKKALDKLRRYHMRDLLLMQELATERRRLHGITEHRVVRPC